MTAPKLIVAIDLPDLAEAEDLARRLAPFAHALKVGSTLFSAHGPEAIMEIGQHGRLFCDLKFHDIPDQVAGGVKALVDQRVWMLTVHASGGIEMMKAAKEAAGPEAKVVAVTVLTSLQASGTTEQVLRLTEDARMAGLDGVVCSPQEVGAIKDRFGSELELVVPGVRPAGADRQDQLRVATPSEVRRAGADYAVVGRPIVMASDPELAAKRIGEELGGAL